MPAPELSIDPFDLLRTVPSLRSLSNTDLGRVAALLEEREVAASELLTEEGTPGDQSFLIVGGTAIVEAGGEVIARVGPGDFVGELSLLTDEPRCATVRSQTAMRVLVLDKATLRSLIDPLAEALLGTLARRLRSRTEADARAERRPEPAVAIGSPVALRSRYDGRWVDGFELADIDLSGPAPRVQVRRSSDGAVLPMSFASDDIRPA